MLHQWLLLVYSLQLCLLSVFQEWDTSTIVTSLVLVVIKLCGCYNLALKKVEQKPSQAGGAWLVW